MSSDFGPVIVAIVGVAGTLASALFTQQLAQRSRMRELEHAERRRVAERADAERTRALEQLRGIYAQLHANDRNYRDAMLAHVHALTRDAAGASAEAAEVTAARRSQRDVRTQAQMIASDGVLRSESPVNKELTTCFGLVKQLERTDDPQRRADLARQTIHRLDQIIPLLSAMGSTMRRELGVTD